MKKIIFFMGIVFLSSGFSQEQSKEKGNPCFDKEYKRIKVQIEQAGMYSLDKREWEYFQLKDKQCSEYPEYENIITKEEEPVEPITFKERLVCSTYICAAGFVLLLIADFQMRQKE